MSHDAFAAAASAPPGREAPDFARLQRGFLLLGVVALAPCLVGALGKPAQFFHAYLVGYLLWAGIGIGCLGLLMLHHLVGGWWGFVTQRVLESGARTMPVLALLFVPLLFGLASLYQWAQPQAVAASALLQHKAPYLNVPFFVARALLYFLLWGGAAQLLSRWSAAQDRTGDPALTRRIQLLSGPGLALFGFTVTFAAVDWAMSIEPEWFSTLFGAVFLVGQGLGALAFAIVMVGLLADRRPLAAVLSPARFHDLGNLLLAFVMLWAYLAFSQLLIIWSGNLPEEIHWYLHRMHDPWRAFAFFLIGFHFVIPFLLLLSRFTKRHGRILLGVAAGLLGMRALDLFWLITPTFHEHGFDVHWMDPLVPIGLGGLWLAAFFWQLRRQPLLPAHDPRFAGALESGQEAHA
jgi:hypothetical protein